MKQAIAYAALCALLLSGCAQQTSVVEPAAGQTGAANPQVQALEQAEQAGLLEPAAGDMLSEEEALKRVSDTIDTTSYRVEQTG